MTPLGQIVQKNLSCFDTGDELLWINPPADDSWQAFGPPSARLSMHCQNFCSWENITQAEGTAHFGAFPDPGPYQQVLLSLPHSKARLEMMLDCSAAILTEGGKLWLVGENRAGIRSAGLRLKNRFGNVRTIDSARHCRLYEASHASATRTFERDNYCHHWQLDDEFASLKMCSWPGVFAHGRLDEGTRMLLEAIPSLNVTGSVLDFGCGSGVISASLLHHHDNLSLTMLDVDAFALLSAETTLSMNGLEGEVVAGNGMVGLDKQFDLVISNPPFHEGHATDTKLSMNLLDPKWNYLAPGGSVVLVVNRHLPYAKWLDRTFGEHQVLTENTRYQVLQATRTH